jgi:MFS superfamily sulfate permease-like transporter
MSDQQRDQILQVVLIVVGLIFVFGVWTLMKLWPAGWQWQPNQAEYEQMIVGVYATLGVFLLVASRAPRTHRSLILFTAWSSLVHAGIMLVQAFRDTAEHGHLFGDIPALAIVGIALLLLAPRGGAPVAAG